MAQSPHPVTRKSEAELTHCDSHLLFPDPPVSPAQKRVKRVTVRFVTQPPGDRVPVTLAGLVGSEKRSTSPATGVSVRKKDDRCER